MTDKITLKAAIVNSGITQDSLAKHIGITRQALWYRVKNYKKMRSKDLVEFCQLINFDINNLDFEERQC